MIATIDQSDRLFDREALAPLLDASAERHRHLCPRQVLGIRMGLLGLCRLNLLGEGEYLFDNAQKRLLTILETDGCGADGVAVAVDCHVGRRTLRVVDFGKMAATFVDTVTGQAIRIAPSAQSRELALEYAPNARSRWHAYLEAYQVMPDDVLLEWQPVQLNTPVSEIISRPGVRALCDVCREEIINEREVVGNGRILCRACAGESYYRPLQEKMKPMSLCPELGYPSLVV